MIKRTILAVVSALAVTSIPVYAGGTLTHWGYEGHSGPNHWAELSEQFATCGSGSRQSPIDIRKGAAMKAKLPSIAFDYKPTTLELLNNGHTIQANYERGSGMEIDGKRYDLLQFHFHTPSENRVEGRPYPMEMHLVHKNKQGKLAVVSVFIKRGKHNEVIQKLWDDMPDKVGDKHALSQNLAASDLLPAQRSFSHFKGSLTTPPCSEGVNWYVMDTPIEVSESQINRFTKVIGHNARPVQSLNDRFVLSRL